MKHIHTFLLVAACAMALSFVACTPDDVENQLTYRLTEETPFVLSNYYTGVADSTYGLSFAVWLRNGQLEVQGLKPTVGFHGLLTTAQFVTGVEIAQFGKAKHLGKITTIPAAAAFSDKAPVEQGYGYVIKAYGSIDLEAIGTTTNHPGVKNPDTLYLRLALTEELKEGGFTMAYAFPFAPTEE